MSESIVSSINFPKFHLWDKMKAVQSLMDFDLELTARCNNDCRHCYINLPAGDKAAKAEELSIEEIDKIAEEAVSMGAIWCLVSGGEPLLRRDFTDIYLCLKRKGLLITVFTNATLITEEHVELFKKYPPRDIKVTVYGVTEDTYARVTQRRGNFSAFMRGLNLLLDNGVRVRLKSAALKSNFHEHEDIAQFCRERTRDYFRFDPLIHLRYDGDPVRNEMIKSERLSTEQIVQLERADPDRSRSMEDQCDSFIFPNVPDKASNYLFGCGAGKRSFIVSYNGILRLCSSLWHPDCTYDIRKGSVADAWNNFIPSIRYLKSDRKEFLEKCAVCPVINLCLWCPAHSYLETGELDLPVDYFCEVAYARAEALKEATLSKEE